MIDDNPNTKPIQKQMKNITLSLAFYFKFLTATPISNGRVIQRHQALMEESYYEQKDLIRCTNSIVPERLFTLFPCFCCHPLITFANSFDPDQDRHGVSPDLDPNRLTL